MKITMKLGHALLLVLSLVLMVSCEGDQGEIGPQGIQGEPGRDGVDGTNGVDGTDGQDGQDGVDGQDGQDGENGEDGADGNANVITSDWIPLDLSNPNDFNWVSFDITDASITQEVLDNYAILGYLKSTRTPTTSLVLSLPFIAWGTGVYYYQQVRLGTYTVVARAQDTATPVRPAADQAVRYVLIQATNTSTTGKSIETSPSSFQKMLDAGIDTTDYNAVAQYLNLE